MRRIAETDRPYEIDWHRIEHGNGEPVILLDPFQTEVDVEMTKSRS